MITSLRSIIASGRTTLRTQQVLRHFSSTPIAMSFPKSIQAIAINKNGDVDVINKEAVPFPEHAPGNIVIKVRRSLSALHRTSQLKFVRQLVFR